MDNSLRSAVVLLVFNRPALTARVFARLRAARPRRLLVVCDGPRAGRQDDVEAVAEVRRIVTQVDWPCDLLTDFAEQNLGCRRRVSSGLDWAFSQTDEAIVLEDDCLPDPSFFPFCDELLARYRDDERVMMITGLNPVAPWKADRQSYHFSYCGAIWGWASWARAWRYYDVEMRAWDDAEARDRVRDVFADPMLYEPRIATYERVRRGEVDTWDMQWSFARIIQSGLSVVPAVNLIQNIGVGGGATHTRSAHPMADLPTTAITWPLRHPRYVAVDREYDRTFTRHLKPPSRQ